MFEPVESENPNYPFLNGGGEMGQLIRSVNWHETHLGPPENWPSPLKLMTGMLLSSSFPVLICWGTTYTQIYNDAFRPILGLTKHPQALGISASETFAEIWDTIGPMFKTVMGGQTVGFPNFMVPLDRNGYLEDCYFDFSYSPIRDEQGHIGGILVICMETTDKVNAHQKLEQNSKKLQSINEEIAMANEELSATNEELAQTQEHLKKLLVELTESDAKFRSVIKEAPVAIALLNGRNLIVEAVNDLMLGFWSKPAAITGSPLSLVMPELEGQSFFELMDEVFNTGKTYYGNEARAMIAHNGRLKECYFNFIYQPLKNDLGKTTSIILVATEVTEQVNSRKQIEKINEQFRMAIGAANLGTWNAAFDTNELIISARASNILGLDIGSGLSIAEANRLILPEDRQRARDTIKKAIEEGTSFEQEFQIQPFDGSDVKWLRITGKAYKGQDGRLQNITGTMIDITEKKLDELRKNDFIGMVSHELKTPLTSLSAIVQMANIKLKDNKDAFLKSAMDKAYAQTKKMSNMINGFLNISRLESGKIHLNIQPFNLDELVKEIVEEITLTNTSHHITFAPCDPLPVNADRDKIGSVISNLLGNAIKYSEKDTEVKINCEIKDNLAQISVTDQGMGINARDTKRLFERFYRVEGLQTQHVAGFGIGLYLSAEIIKRHSGNIWVESIPGKGATFFFNLPV